MSTPEGSQTGYTKKQSEAFDFLDDNRTPITLWKKWGIEKILYELDMNAPGVKEAITTFYGKHPSDMSGRELCKVKNKTGINVFGILNLEYSPELLRFNE